jgi:Flp pilus assembly protein TadG
MNGRRKYGFLRNEGGSTAVEFALLSIVFFGMILGAIDMARLAWEMNLAKAATRAGARFAATNTMASSYLQSYDSGLSPGSAVLENSSSVPPITCTSTGCAGNGGSGQTGYDSAAFTAIVNRMRVIYPRLQAANVSIEYRHVGIGFAGNPFAPDVEPLITVRTTGLTFRPGSLRIFGVTSLPIPAAASTMSGEDLGS